MRVLLVLVCTVFSFLLQAAPADSTLSRLYDTQEVVPVQPDSSLFQKFRSDSQYDYYSHRVKDERSIWNYLVEKFFRWLTENMNMDVKQEQVNHTLLIIGIVLVIGFLILLYIYRPSIFFRDKKRKHDYRLEEETIYGLDFEQLIDAALRDKAYNHAIRWKYLQTLKYLQDKELIDWNPTKTINEYVYEMKNAGLRTLFKDMSTYFLYFHYGNFEATEVHYLDTFRLSDEIKKTTGE